MTSAARHLSLVPATGADVIPLPRRGMANYTAERHNTLATVATCAVTRRGSSIRIDGQPASAHQVAGLADTDRAGLTAWYRQDAHDHVALLTAEGIAALAQWGGTGNGGDAA